MAVHPATEKQLILTSYLFALLICHEIEVLNIVIKLLSYSPLHLLSAELA
jgi:hypothetical protein